MVILLVPPSESCYDQYMDKAVLSMEAGAMMPLLATASERWLSA